MSLIGALIVSALAHDPVGSFGLRPLLQEGELAAAWTTWGPVQLQPSGEALRVCEEAHPGLRDLWLRRDGSLVLATPTGLASSSDGGCSQAASAITDPVSALIELGDELVAVLQRPGGDVLAVSSDGLLTHEVIELPLALDVRSVALGGDARWWIAGLHGTTPTLLHGLPGALAEAPLPGPALLSIAVHGPGPDGTGVTVSTLGEEGAGTLWILADDTYTLLAELPLAVSGYGCVADRCLVAVNQSLLLGWDRAAPAPVIPEVVEGPARCLWSLGDALWGCTSLERPGHFERTTDGRTFDPQLLRATILERDCPTDTPAAERCALPLATADTGAPIESPGPPPEPSGCGCAQGPGLGWGVLILPALALVRRSRADGDPS
ncbi:MAG TPA: hypothetical protein ENK18_19270 [Deltaproteobacteria bacterium]|nr:hypothetical protein [Deltaproteobacteria bacterium]